MQNAQKLQNVSDIQAWLYFFSISRDLAVFTHFATNKLKSAYLPTIFLIAPNSAPWLSPSPNQLCFFFVFFVHFEILVRNKKKEKKMSNLPKLTIPQRKKLAGAKKYCMEQTLR